MPVRIWFKADTPLPAADRAILNRAGRLLEDRGVVITSLVLSGVRQGYKAGMTAIELADHCDPRD